MSQRSFTCSTTVSPGGRRRISSVNVLGVGAALESVPPVASAAPATDLDALMSDMATLHQQTGGGLLITIDEAHVAGSAEIRDFARVFQHCRGRRLPLVFLGAGLTHLRRILESGTDATFLQRCKWYEIGRLTSKQTHQALRLTLAIGGGRTADADLDRMAEVCDGYPYMIQLVGASVWAAASDPTRITSAEVDIGLREASAEFGPEVYGPIWDDMSPTDKKLAVAMLYRDGASAVSDLSRRWGGSSSSFYTYRARLVNAGLIRSDKKGSVTFAHPSARTLVLEQAKSDGWRLTPDGTPIPPAPTADLPIAVDITDMITTPNHNTSQQETTPTQ